MNNPGVDAEDAKTIDDIARALVRPIVTVLFAMAFIAFTWLGLISGEVFSAIAGTVIAFWFSSRNQDKQDNQEGKMVAEVADALQKTAAPQPPMSRSEPS